jgi:hypothetical protein
MYICIYIHTYIYIYTCIYIYIYIYMIHVVALSQLAHTLTSLHTFSLIALKLMLKSTSNCMHASAGYRTAPALHAEYVPGEHSQKSASLSIECLFQRAVYRNTIPITTCCFSSFQHAVFELRLSKCWVERMLFNVPCISRCCTKFNMSFVCIHF